MANATTARARWCLRPPTCGDGFTQAGVEECDDGNMGNTDACVAMCKPAKCGDSFVSTGVEECDDGNILPGDSCSPMCKIEFWSEDFEGGAVLPPEWQKSGNLNWFGSMNMPHGGVWVGESGHITHSQTSVIQVTLNYTAAGNVSFLAPYQQRGQLRLPALFIDGVEQGKWSGVTAWTQTVYPVPAGSHTLRWSYTKDGSVNGNADTVWIDDITTTNAFLP